MNVSGNIIDFIAKNRKQGDLMDKLQNIDSLTTEIIILKQQTAQNIIEIGKRLKEVKESLPHGEWGKWLNEKVKFSERSAQYFMRASAEYGGNPQLVAEIGTTKIFMLMESFSDADEREQFIQKNQINEMSKRELQQAIKAQKEAERKAHKEEEKAKLIQEEKESLQKKI